MNPHTSDILTFIQFAKKGETSRKLRGLIEHIPLSDVMAWRDEDGLDLMHHVILGNNSELVAFLLQHNFFVRPHIPEVNPYSHLAALLGERALLQVLLQHRPDDYYPSKVSIRLPQSVIDSLAKNNKMNTSTVLNSTRLSGAGSTSSSSSSTSSSSSLPNNSTGNFYKTESLSELLKNLSNQATSPLDIASRAGHLQCVKIILNQCVLKKHSEDTLLDKSDYTLACIADSPLSLALLIHEQAPSREEWEGAVQVCLHYARPECLDLLLQQKRDTKQMFKGMNFYHVLYTYTSVQGASSYPKLAQTTEVLVKHGHKVGAKVPCRTYPMYSLLTHAFCFHDYSNTQYYIKVST
ncbi:ankyrin repeat and death domain-containing protein 1B isoform X2 [Biomphalaria glabrata]|nr:ankyrin repeat and death domain-containing protein 1B isoform X2 [Biomphalaria glabrata]